MISQLKAEYRSRYETVQALKMEIPYCEQHVNQCRQRMLTEFDAWYHASFIGDGVEDLQEGEDDGKGVEIKGAKRRSKVLHKKIINEDTFYCHDSLLSCLRLNKRDLTDYKLVYYR